MKNIKLIIGIIIGFMLSIGISNAYILNANLVTYDKKNTTLESEDVQGAIDELGILANTLTDTSDATASASDIASGKTAYVNGNKITGTMKVLGEVSDIALMASGSYSLTPTWNDGYSQYIANKTSTYTYTASSDVIAFKFQFETSSGGTSVSMTNIKGTTVKDIINDGQYCKTYILEGIKAGETISIDLGYAIWSSYSNTRTFTLTGYAVFG